MNIKTMAEVREGRVTVQIEAPTDFFDDRMTVTITVPATGPAEAYDPEKAAQVMAGNYQRARERVTELEAELDRARKGHVCTERCTRDRHVAFTGRQRLIEAEQQVNSLEIQLEVSRQQVTDLKAQAQHIAQEANARERRQAEEIGRRFTAQQVEDAKADARAEARNEIRTLISAQRVNEARQRPDTEADPDFIGSPMGSWRTLSDLIGELRSLLDN